jgi:ABC-type Fe3+-siderophore transport system permease subunit
MQTVKRLVLAYAVIVILLLMFVVVVGRMLGPAELAIGVIVALVAAVYCTRKIVSPAAAR